MYRLFGAVAIFVGWLTIPIGATAGLIVSQFFGIGHVEGTPPPVNVYGVSGIAVFWVYVCATVLTALPLILASVALDPRRPLRLAALSMAIFGLALLPSELGRAFGLPLLIGAGSVWVGAELVHRGAGAPALFGDLRPGDAAPPAGPDSAGVDELADAVAAAGNRAAPEPAPVAGVVGSAAIAQPSAGRVRSARLRARREARVATRTCPWCSSDVPAADPECASCGAALGVPAVEELAIPGVTEVPSALRRYAENARSGKRRASLLKMIFSDTDIPTVVNGPRPSDAEALRPPSAALRAEIARLDAEIAAGAVSPRRRDEAGTPGDDETEGTSPPDPAGPESSHGATLGA